MDQLSQAVTSVDTGNHMFPLRVVGVDNQDDRIAIVAELNASIDFDRTVSANAQ